MIIYLTDNKYHPDLCIDCLKPGDYYKFYFNDQIVIRQGNWVQNHFIIPNGQEYYMFCGNKECCNERQKSVETKLREKERLIRISQNTGWILK